MIWPFPRKPKPLNPGPINEDWRVGDLAECLASGGFWQGRPGPERGDVLKVRAVSDGLLIDGTPAWGLQLGDGELWYRASRFRKVPPLNGKATAEFTAQIKGLKPKERARRMAATARRAA